MLSFSSFLPFAMALLFPSVSAESCQARLEVQQQEHQLTIIAHCRNQSADVLHLRYELETERDGANGSSRSTQGGRCTAAPGQDIVVSRVSVSATPSDRLLLRLRLLDQQGTVLAADSVEQTAP